ncbi:MAG: hypothetical protein AAF798_09585 [Bacteroidota bacterium]
MLSFLHRNVIIAILLISLAQLQAQDQNALLQPKINSPYSRFGLGDLVDQHLAAAGGMGGLSAAFVDAYNVNIMNPASLARLQSTAFEVGFYAKYSSLEGQDETQGIWSGNLNYLVLAFPLKNPINKVLDRDNSPWGLGMSFSLLPYSQVGYNIQIATDRGEDLGEVEQFLKGSGGTYRVNWGNALRYRNIAVGVNLGYTFGKILNSRRVEYNSFNNFYNTELLDDISVGGLFFNVGVQYAYYFKKPGRDGVQVATSKRLVIGAYANPNLPFNTQTSRFYHRDNFEYGVLDTIVAPPIVELDGTLPAEYGIGITYEKINNFRVGVEYKGANWSSYENEAKDESLSNTYRISIGGEWTPNYISYNSYLERVRYRFGAFYGNDPRSFAGEQLTHFGLTLGFGFPIILPRQQVSFLNLAIEAGRFGLSDGLNETYARITLGFTLNDNSWFFKRKFN